MNVMARKQIKLLAETFRNMLVAEIGKKNFQEVRRRNRKHRDDGCCASHDFCDANVTMDAAFTDVTGRETCHSDEDVALWNAAWDYAKQHYLTARR